MHLHWDEDKTIIQEDAQKLDKIIVSGGKFGLQLILLPETLNELPMQNMQILSTDDLKKCKKM